MLLEKITNEELEFMEIFHNPIALTECLFYDFDNMGLWDDEKLGSYRLFQYSMISYEYLIDDIPGYSEKDNFKLREGAGNIWCFGGRKYGKSLCVEKLDIPIDMLVNDGNDVGFSSMDMMHIKGILECIIQCLQNHPILQIYEPRVNRSPSFNFYLKNGYRLESVNMNLTGPEPGKAFFQKHFKKIYIEEASFETEKVYEKRIEAVSEKGAILRIAGMTNFTKYSPSGKIFYDLTKRNWIANHPQYVSPIWDNEQKKKAIKDHGGEGSISYRVFVKGEIVEEGLSVFDMERIRPNYDEKHILKRFEINKDNLVLYQNILVVEKPKNAEECYIAADIGETAPTEIIILFKINGKWKYSYNITCYNLTDKEQEKIFKYLISCVKPNIVALDTTEGTGRAIYRSLEMFFPKEQLVWCGFNEKLVVGFQKDANNSVIIKDGKPIEQEEYISEWSIKRLKELFYDNILVVPLDYRLDVQLNSVISTMSSNRVVYECVSEEDHLLSAFRVFSIAQWINELRNTKPMSSKIFSKSGV